MCVHLFNRSVQFMFGITITVKTTAFREALTKPFGLSTMAAFKVILIFTGIVVIIGLGLAVICLLAMSRENQLPDIDDI